MKQHAQQPIDPNEVYSSSVFDNPEGPDIDIFVRAGVIEIGVHDGQRRALTVLTTPAAQVMAADLGRMVSKLREKCFLVSGSSGVYVYDVPGLAPLGIGTNGPPVVIELDLVHAAGLMLMLLEAVTAARVQAGE